VPESPSQWPAEDKLSKAIDFSDGFSCFVMEKAQLPLRIFAKLSTAKNFNKNI
jgi:hypothetical protein